MPTIDNLGPEASNQYARNQATVDRSLLKEAQKVYPPDVLTTIPYQPEYKIDLFLTGLSFQVLFPLAPAANSAVFTVTLDPDLGFHADLQDKVALLTQMEENASEPTTPPKELKKMVELLSELAKLEEFIKAQRIRFQKG